MLPGQFGHAPLFREDRDHLALEAPRKQAVDIVIAVVRKEQAARGDVGAQARAFFGGKPDQLVAGHEQERKGLQLRRRGADHDLLGVYADVRVLTIEFRTLAATWVVSSARSTEAARTSVYPTTAVAARGFAGPRDRRGVSRQREPAAERRGLAEAAGASRPGATSNPRASRTATRARDARHRMLLDSSRPPSV